MAIKFKVKDGKDILVARDDVQAAAFIKAGFVPATKADEEKLNPKEEKE
jgi:hypothetical protein